MVEKVIIHDPATDLERFLQFLALDGVVDILGPYPIRTLVALDPRLDFRLPLLHSHGIVTLATTLRDADRMIEALERNKTVCSVEHTRRWDPFFHRAKEIIDVGLIGDVRTVTGTLHGERAMIFRNGTHILDLMVYYAGATPTHVFSMLEEGFNDFTEYGGDGGHDPASEPGASAFIQFENGVRGFYNGTKGTPANAEWDIAGTKGRLRISASEASLWTLDPETNELVQRAFPASMVTTGVLQGAYLELFAALADGQPLRSTPRDARNTVALLEGVLASQQQGNRLVALN